jgi:hypothetical protein
MYREKGRQHRDKKARRNSVLPVYAHCASRHSAECKLATSRICVACWRGEYAGMKLGDAVGSAACISGS